MGGLLTAPKPWTLIYNAGVSSKGAGRSFDRYSQTSILISRYSEFLHRLVRPMNRFDGEGFTGVVEDEDTVGRTAAGHANDDMAPVAFDLFGPCADSCFCRFTKFQDENIARTGIGSIGQEAFEDARSRVRR